MGRQVHVVVLQGLLEVERHPVGGGALNLYHVVRVIVLEREKSDVILTCNGPKIKTCLSHLYTSLIQATILFKPKGWSRASTLKV